MSPAGVISEPLKGDTDAAVTALSDGSLLWIKRRVLRRYRPGIGDSPVAGHSAYEGKRSDGMWQLARLGLVYDMLPVPTADGPVGDDVLLADYTDDRVRRLSFPTNNCDDELVCTADSCGKNGVCVHKPAAKGSKCDDGNRCTAGDTCDGNKGCVAGKLVKCKDGDACNSSACDPWTGKCEAVARTGHPCEDDDACHGPRHCFKGKCQKGVNQVSWVAGMNGIMSKDGPVNVAVLRDVADVARDPDGGLVFIDKGNFLLRRYDPAGYVESITGGGYGGLKEGKGSKGYPGIAKSVWVDRNGWIYWTTGPDIGRLAEGHVRRYCGSGHWGHVDGPCGSARLQGGGGQLTSDNKGNLLLAEPFGHRIRRISPKRIVTTLAGDGTAGYLDGPVAKARFRNPSGLAVGADGTVWVGDRGNKRLRKITGEGVFTAAGGGSGAVYTGTPAAVQLPGPVRLAAATDGRIFVASAYLLQSYTPTAVTRELGSSVGITADTAGGIYLANSGSLHHVRPEVTSCDDGNPCTKDACDTKTGDCNHVPLPAGATCNDDDACTKTQQ